MTKNRDILHRFDGKGRSKASFDELEKRNSLLEHQVERLKRILRRQSALNPRENPAESKITVH